MCVFAADFKFCAQSNANRRNAVRSVDAADAVTTARYDFHAGRVSAATMAVDEGLKLKLLVGVC